MYQFKVHRIGDVCTLQAWVLACNTLLHMLLYQFVYKKKNWKFELQKEDIKTSLSMNILIVCKLLGVFTTHDSCLWLHVALCALHELNYNLKVVILAI